MRWRTVEAAEALEADGVQVEVIDPRTLAPLDLETIVASVERTGRLVCVQESPPAGSWGSTVITAVVERAFDRLDAPPSLVASDATPVPYAGALEGCWLPSTERIAGAIRRTAEH